MNLLDATWKRAAFALVASAAGIFAVTTFANSSYVETQKIQIESARSDHCKKWGYVERDGANEPVCQKWSKE